MDKSIFVKEFQYSRRLQRNIRRVDGESDAAYTRRVKIAKYGLEGEDNAYYQLKNICLPIVCLSDIRLSEKYGSAQADFVVISKDNIFLLEVKNLYGSVRVTEDGDVIRIIPRGKDFEQEGMKNPFTQIRRQADVFKIFFEQNQILLPIKTSIVMGNPKTSIFHDGEKYPIIRYDKLREYFEANVTKECSLGEYDYILEVGEILKLSHKERFYNDFELLKNKMEKYNQFQPKLEGDDLILYEELLEIRRGISKRLGWPLCNVFLNRDAVNLVIHKPVNKEQLISIPGFKERKYMLCGEDIIALIKKHIDKTK